MRERADAPSWSPKTVALLGHRSAGKTSLGEMLLQAARVTRTVGRVDDGSSLLDWTDEERRQRTSTQLATAWFEHRDVPLVLVDTPGAPGLGHTQQRGLHVADGAVLVVDAGDGVQLGTERALRWLQASTERDPVPTVVAVTKVDRWAGGLDALVHDLEHAIASASGHAVKVVPLQLPVRGPAGHLEGLVDVLGQQLLRYADDGSGAWSPEPLPEGLTRPAGAAREAIAEAVALTDDALLEQYLEDLELSEPDLRRGLERAVGQGRLVPLVLTSATRHIGATPLLDALAAWMPGPRHPRVRHTDGSVSPLPGHEDFVAEVVACQTDRDGHPVTWIKIWQGEPPRGAWQAIDPRGRPREVRIRKLYRVRGPRRATARPGPGALVATWDPIDLAPGTTLTRGLDLEVLSPPPPPPQMAWQLHLLAAPTTVQGCLDALVRADPALQVEVEPASGAWLLWGVSETHLRRAVRQLAERSGAAVTTGLPPVHYVEVPSGPVSETEAEHEVRGDHGLVSQYARCVVRLRPGADPRADAPLSYADDAVCDEETLPKRFRPAVAEGARQALQHGPLAGYPVAGVELALLDGDYDMLCSTEEHFREAGAKATRMALSRTGTRLLEPWHEVRIEAPQQAVGEIIADVAAHRGRLLGMEVVGTTAELVAQCPYRELRTFAVRLEALTGGRGRFRSVPTHHERLPEHLVADAIEHSPFRGSC